MRVAVTLTDDLQDGSHWSAFADQLHPCDPDLVLLPELPFSRWLCDDPNFNRHEYDLAIEAHQQGIERLRELPWATVTTVPQWQNGRRINQPVVVEDGEIRLLGAGKALLPNHTRFYERQWFDPAPTTSTVATVAGAVVGVLPCSDLWAQERVREFAKLGAQLVLTPRTTSASGASRWLTLGMTTALMGGVFWLSANRIEPEMENGFGGAAWVIGPDGSVLQELHTEGTAYVDIALEDADAAKQDYPCSLYVK